MSTPERPYEVTHACPPKGEGLTPCCGKTPFDLSMTDRITLDPSLVTCGTKRCCRWDHVRPCGPVPGNPTVDDGGEPICACGCSGYDERCGGGEWWLPMDSMEDCLALNADIEAGRIYGFKGHTLDELIDLHSRPTRGDVT